MIRKICGALILSSMMFVPNVASAQGLEPFQAWFIVVGTSNHDPLKDQKHTDAIWRNAEKCGFSTFSDFSSKFSGVKPGYQLHVVEPFYQSKASAVKDLNKVKKCIPDAYVKKSVYAGE